MLAALDARTGSNTAPAPDITPGPPAGRPNGAADGLSARQRPGALL